MRSISIWLLPCALALALSGCLTLPNPPPPQQPVAPIAGARPLRLGSVTGGSAVNFLWLRANPLSPPEGHWVDYLKAALQNELDARGLSDPRADKVLDVIFLENSFGESPGFSTAKANVRARFTVYQGALSLYDREQCADTEFESSILYPVMMSRLKTAYPRLYRQLFDALFADPDFQAALRR